MSSLFRDDWTPAFAGTTIAATRSLHKNLAATMRATHDAFFSRRHHLKIKSLLRKNPAAAGHAAFCLALQHSSVTALQ